MDPDVTYIKDATIDQLERVIEQIPLMSGSALDFVLEWAQGQRFWLLEYDLNLWNNR